MKGNYQAVSLPERFVENIRGLHGEAGEKWLARLPLLVREIGEKSALEIEPPFSNLSYNFVAPCTRLTDGVKAVLKIAFPEKDPLIASEAKMLKILDGRGCVGFLDYDREYCALLMERLLPGENLIEICRRDDERATAIAIELLRKCWGLPASTVAAEFPTLEKWIESLARADSTKLPSDLIKKAQIYFGELLAAGGENFLLHGDFHHENILSGSQNGRAPFLAIDPKGIIGEMGFEISVFLNNPRSWVLNHPEKERVLKKRLEMFSAGFGIEPENLRKWAFSEAVLSAWWTIEDNGEGWEKWLAYAGVWETIKI